MNNKSTAEIVGIIVGELSPLSSEDRHRVIQASMTLLGEKAAEVDNSPGDIDEAVSDEVNHLPVRAQNWVRQNSLTTDQLQQVFHFESGTVELIAADLPGKSNKERVRNAYLLTGIRALLCTGEAKFEDRVARMLCDLHGAYDQTNHSKALKGRNEFTGSRDKGWTLTAPGLKDGAILIKEISDMN
jgi:hypothetical protein